MRRHCFFFISIAASLMGLRQPVALATEVSSAVTKTHQSVYSETLYASRGEIASNATQLRLLYDVLPVLRFALVGGVDYATQVNTARVADYSHSYGGAGIEWSLWNLKLRNEWRANQYVQDFNGSRTHSEIRNQLIGGSFWTHNGQWNGDGIWFVESYAEVTHSTLIKENVVANGLGRAGNRVRYWNGFAFDAYLEPFLSWDSQGLFYNRVFEPRSVLRAGYQSDSFSSQLSYMISPYFYLPSARKGEQSDGTYQRLLFTIGYSS